MSKVIGNSFWRIAFRASDLRLLPIKSFSFRCFFDDELILVWELEVDILRPSGLPLGNSSSDLCCSYDVLGTKEIHLDRKITDESGPDVFEKRQSHFPRGLFFGCKLCRL